MFKQALRLSIIAAVILGVWSSDGLAQNTQVTGSRELPESPQVPGTTFSATVAIQVDEGNVPNALILLEDLPVGWTPSNPTPEWAAFDAGTGEVKWLFGVTDAVEDRAVTYDVTIPIDLCTAPGTFALSGALKYNDPQGDPVENTVGGDNEVVVADTEDPVARCTEISVNLSEDGTASIGAGDVDGGSSDNCGIVSREVVPDTFTCANFGANTVTLTVADAAGNTDQCQATVTVQDDVAPTAVCKNVTAQLDASGSASIAAADVDGGSSDNCGIVSRDVTPRTFTCANLGANTVTLTVADAAGNTDQCQGTVTVRDNLPPIAVCKNLTVELDASGSTSITAADVDGGSTDNCGIVLREVVPDTFRCPNLGPNEATLTVGDAAGNKDDCTAIVTVLDPENACEGEGEGEGEPDDWDPADDEPSGATVLSEPTTGLQEHGPHTLGAERPESQDWFQVPLQAGVRYGFSSVSSSGEIDAVFLHIDPGDLETLESLGYLAYADASSDSFALCATPWCTGAHYLAVIGSGAYTLRYSVSGDLPTDDPWDYEDDVPTGGTLLNDPTGCVQSHGPHLLSRNDFIDCFRVYLAAGMEYEFSSVGTTGDALALLFWAADLADACSLTGAVEEMILALDEDSGEGGNFEFTYETETSGEYLLLVWNAEAFWKGGVGLAYKYGSLGAPRYAKQDYKFTYTLEYRAFGCEPSAPTGVSATDGTYTNKVRVTWNTSVGATSYEIWRNTVDDSESAALRDRRDWTAFEDRLVEPCTVYFYWVKAKNGCGTSDFSESDSGYRDAPPLPPEDVSVDCNGSALVSWAASPIATSYHVYRNGTAIGSWQSGTSYNDPSASATSCYRVRAKNNCGMSHLSAEACCTCERPAAPTGVSADWVSDRCRVTWNAAAGATSYEIYRNTVEDSGSAECIATREWNAFEDRSAAPCLMYYYWVMAKNACGTSDFSDAAQCCTPPVPPTGVEASDGTYCDKVVVTWNPVEGSGITYPVYRDDRAIGSWQSGTLYLYPDTGAEPCQRVRVCNALGCCRWEDRPTKHSYKVKAENACGESGFSASDTGYRKCCGKALDADGSIYEKALPVADAESQAELAVRVISDEPVQPDSVWALLEGDGWVEEGGVWRATVAGDDRDGWVVFTPSEALAAGETVTLTAGGVTVSGVEIEPVTAVFEVASGVDKTRGSSPLPFIAAEESDAVAPLAEAAGGSVYRIGPAGVFDAPAPVWIPVPQGADTDALEVCYFSEAEEHRGWYRAENVIGWMVPGSRRTVVEDGQTYIEIEVNHSGVVQLARPVGAPKPNGADIGLLLGVALVLSLAGSKRAHAMYEKLRG